MGCIEEHKKISKRLGGKFKEIAEVTINHLKFLLPAKFQGKLPEYKNLMSDLEVAREKIAGQSGFFQNVVLRVLKIDPERMTKKQAQELFEKINSKSGDVDWDSFTATVRGRYNNKIKEDFKKKNKPLDESKLLGKITPYIPRIFKPEVRELLAKGSEKLTEVLRDANLKNASDEVLKNVLRSKALRAEGFKLSKDIKGFEGKNVLVSAIEHLIANSPTKLSVREAMRLLERDTNADIFVDVPFVKTRKLELPSSFYETDMRIILPRYIEGMSRRIGEIEQFGLGSEGVLKKLEAIRKKDYDEYRTALKVVTKWSGVYQQKHALTGFKRKILDAITAFQVATKIGLGQGTVLNTTQWIISTLPQLGVWNLVRGGVDIINPTRISFKGGSISRGKRFRSKLKESGLIDQMDKNAVLAAMGELPGGAMGKFALFTTKWSGFTAINKLNLYWAAASFLRAQTLWRKQAQGTGRLAELRRKQLKDFGIDYRKEMTQAELHRKMFTFATKSQLQKNVLEEPLFFSEPAIIPFLLFKRFGYRQATMVTEMLWKEAGRGNIAPFIRLAAAGYAGGAMSIWALNQIKETLSGEPKFEPEDTFVNKVINHVGMIGAFGLVGDLVGFSSDRGVVDRLIFAGSPVVLSDVFKLADTYTRVMEDWERYGDGWLATERNAHRFFSVTGTYTYQFAKRLKNFGQKERTIISRKSRTRASIFEAYGEGNHKLASNLIAQWNREVPSNPLTMTEVSIREYRKFLLRKARNIVRDRFKKGTPEFRKEFRERLKEVNKKTQSVREGLL